MVKERYHEIAEFSQEIARCGRCGFCQEVCPVYQVSAEESGVARGRNVFASELISGGLDLSRRDEAFFSECLLCRACVDICFSGVKTDEIALAGRRSLRRMRGISPAHRYIFDHLLRDHRRLGRFVRLAASAGRAAAPLRMFGWLGVGLTRANRFAKEIPREFLRERLARREPGGAASKQVVYFIGCGINFMFPRVGEATVAALEALGYEATVVDHGCCGLPAFSHGDIEAARRLALLNIEAFAYDPGCLIVTDCSSCASHLKDYPKLFSTESVEGKMNLARAEGFSARVRDVSEILAEAAISLRPKSGERTGGGQSVTFHEPCHLGRYQRLGDRTREVIRAIPGVDFVEMKEAAWCCGGAGAFAVEHPGLSLAILERKVRNVNSSGADTIVTTCPSCLMQIGGGVSEAGLDIRVRHLVEIAQERLAGRRDVFPNREGDAS